MAEGERDDTAEWVLPPEARPATLAELEQRIDYAVAVARASEAAALEIGAAAIDAAEQARRAATLAQSAAEQAASRPPGDGVAEPILEASLEPDSRSSPAAELDRLRHFLQRADHLSERLGAIAGRPG
jgi:hypothetical protein